ncbi:MAG TPA: S-methyl-5-thioribose kinase [Terriglobales bacterium]|nr:S-methyl-5-thioribose kinase [Terriglobales bacterium]
MSYYLLTEETVVEYVKRKLPAFTQGEFCCKEIGDGNLNYVFRVWREEGPSVIIKQAGDLSRLSKVAYSKDRARIEAEILTAQNAFAAGVVPELYFYDPEMNATAMEDLTGHTIMRKALMEGETFPRFADDITEFMVGMLLGTSDVGMNHAEKKARVKAAVNPELCGITERLIFTEPYLNLEGKNKVFEPNLEWVKKNLYEDERIRLEAAKCKMAFMNKAEALLHGDLHTGSIFVTEESTKVFDPEFGFYGPMGFDLGMLTANLMFAWARATCAYTGKSPRAQFVAWLEETIVEVVELFKRKFLSSFGEVVADPMLKSRGFAPWLLGELLADAAGVCGAELIRRTVGMAGVADLRTIEDEAGRVTAERICVTAGKQLMTYRFQSMSGDDYVEAMKLYR